MKKTAARVAGWVGMVAVGLGMGCGQQPYRVFAVQVGAAPAEAGMAAAGRGAGMKAVALAGAPAGMRAAHPQWDLNEASAATLRGLPGIDAATVAAIIAARPYKAKRELLRRKVVTAAEYARWKEYLVVHRPGGAGRAGA